MRPGWEVVAMQRNEAPRRVVGSGDPLLLTASEAYELARQTDLPAGTYDLMDGIARIYRINTHGDSECRVLFMLAAAFVAGCTYAVEKEGKSHDMRNV